MTMNSGLPLVVVIPADPEAAMVMVRVDDTMRTAQAIAGKPAAALLLPDMYLFASESGRVKGLQRNPRATALADAYEPGFALVDEIAGTAVLTGRSEDGEAGSIPRDVLQHLRFMSPLQAPGEATRVDGQSLTRMFTEADRTTGVYIPEVDWVNANIDLRAGAMAFPLSPGDETGRVTSRVVAHNNAGVPVGFTVTMPALVLAG